MTKAFIIEPGLELSYFGPLSLCFENRILAHMIVTTLVPRKGYLLVISHLEMFLFCIAFSKCI